MSKQWPRVKLGDVLIEQKQRIGAFDGNNLPLLGVSKEEGLHRSGMPRISDMSRYLQVEKDWFAYNPMRINVGSIGWARTPEQTGVISPDYVVFSCSERILPHLLFSFLKHRRGLQEINNATAGSVRERLYFDKLAQIEFLLPPLAEQRRIVARIEELAGQIHEARTLRHQAAEEAEALTHSTVSKLAYETSWETKRLPEVAQINPSRAGNVKLTANDMASFVPMKAVDDVTGTIAWAETRPFHEISKGYTWFTNGDIIFARITPCMQNGKAALAKNLVNGVAFGSTEFHVIRPGKGVCAEWLYHLVRHKAFRDDAAEHFKGTAGQQRVPQSFLEEKLIPVPPLPEQRRIVSELDELQAEVDALKRLQAETAAELDALLPAILDKAFKGEL